MQSQTSEQNFFKYVEVIEASSAELLASKLRAIHIVFQLNAVWSDGKKHYALVNAKRPFPANLKEKLANIK
jgi:hypothetical protein